MSDNVIILGAGASCSAGIPLLGGFMDQMWQMAKLGKHGGVNLSTQDQTLLERALGVRLKLDNYHGRAALDTWNLEEVLSILSFNALAGGQEERVEFDLMTRAIAKTVELTCEIKHDGIVHDPSVNFTNSRSRPGYSLLWDALLSWSNERNANLPVIITFNYDLVLERSLLHSMTAIDQKSVLAPVFSRVKVDYHSKVMQPVALKMSTRWYQRNISQWETINDSGWSIENDDSTHPGDVTNIDILKLHGSNNFPRSTATVDINISSAKRLVSTLEDPLILPPVFNKATDTVGFESWSFALSALRKCKNLIVCGYSLPKTDIYMQYFLKAALGPNQDLNRIFVFDPCLFDDNQRAAGEALKERYGSNFATAIQKRIDYTPGVPQSLHASDRGSFIHFLSLLQNFPDSVLFG